MGTEVIDCVIKNLDILIASGSLIIAIIALKYSKKAYRRQNDSVTLQEKQHLLSLRPEFRIDPNGHQREWFHRTHSQIDHTIVLCENRACEINIQPLNGCELEQTEYEQLPIGYRIIFAVEFPLIVAQHIDLFIIEFSDIEKAGTYRQTVSGNHGYLSITLPNGV